MGEPNDRRRAARSHKVHFCGCEAVQGELAPAAFWSPWTGDGGSRGKTLSCAATVSRTLNAVRDNVTRRQRSRRHVSTAHYCIGNCGNSAFAKHRCSCCSRSLEGRCRARRHYARCQRDSSALHLYTRSPLCTCHLCGERT